MHTNELGDEAPYLCLTAKEARALPEMELRDRVWLITMTLEGEHGRPALPDGFPDHRYIDSLDRTALEAAVERHAWWFDPHGGHPYITLEPAAP